MSSIESETVQECRIELFVLFLFSGIERKLSDFFCSLIKNVNSFTLKFFLLKFKDVD